MKSREAEIQTEWAQRQRLTALQDDANVLHDRLRRFGFVYTDHRGIPRARPEVQQFHRAQMEILKLLRALRMTPLSRAIAARRSSHTEHR